MTYRVQQKMEKIVLGTDVKDIPKLIPGIVLAFFIWYVSKSFAILLGRRLWVLNRVLSAP